MASVNVAASANGGTASASSTVGTGYEAAHANNGDRTGATWGTNGGWNDGTASTFDDWLEIDFNATYYIGELDLFGLQDAYASPSTPTLGMTSTLYGLTSFDLQYWTGSAWATVTGGAITGNTHVWTQVTFTPVSTSKVRVLVHATQDGTYSRVVELEAWTAAPANPNTPTPADGASAQPTSTTLAWASAGATSYDVYFGTSATPGLVSSGQAGATYNPGTLTSGLTYYWKIVAINSTGSTTGSVWSFATGTPVGGLRPTVIVEVELAGVGNGWTNLGATGSQDVITPAGIVVRRGIQGGGPDDNVAGSGSLSFTLDNSTSNSAHLLGYYSLYHANKRSGWGLGIGCRLRLVDPATSISRTRFVGRIDAIDPAPGSKRERYVRVVALDWLDEAARWNLVADIGEQVDKRWDEVLTAILAHMPAQPTATSFDMGVESYPVVLDSSSFAAQPALSEFKKLTNSERGLFYVKADGTLKAEGRHARLLNTTSAWTLPETDYQGLSLPSTRDEIINTVRVTIYPRDVDALPTSIVYDQANVIDIPAGGARFLLGAYRSQTTGDPIGATAVQTLVDGTDYAANSKADGSGTDLTASVTITVTVGSAGANFNVSNANAVTAYLTRLQLRGKAIINKSPVQFKATDTGSIATNGEHVVVVDMPYQASSDVGQGAANYYVDKYSDAFAQARAAVVVGKTAALLTQILQRDISDRISLAETVTGLNNAFFINGEELRVMASGQVAVTYTLAPAQDPFSGLYWVLGTSTLGTDTIPAPF